MSLFSLIQTHSIDDALQPIAEKVRKLKNWTQGPINQNFNTIFKPASSVLEAVQQLAQAAQEQIANGDEDVQKDMKPAYEQTLVAAQHLIEAAKQIEKSTPPVNCHLLYSSTQDILEGSVKILVAWDGSEIRKIIGIAQWTKDRLKLVQAARSMRALVVCYNGFFDAMRQLISCSTQRYQDLIDESKKEKLFACLTAIRKYLPLLSQTMQEYVRNPDTKRQKDKDECCVCILQAIDGIIESIAMPQEQEEEEEDENDLYNISESSDLLSTDDEDDESGNETIATNLKKVQEQLSSSRRSTNIGPQLDTNIKTIIENSKMVARESDEKFKKYIHQLCEEVLSIREELEVHYKAFLEDPTSKEKRAEFDKTVDKLCSKLQELDSVVANSVADQVAQAYLQPSAVIDHLMGAIVTSSSPVDELSGDSMDGLKQTVKVFRQNSRRLSKVAIHAAQGTLNRKRSKRIKKLTTQLDDITRKVVTAAIEVRKNPHDLDKRQQLEELRREWAEKVKDLTKAIDEIINVEDFTAATEATIVDDMAKCRQATERQSWVELETTVRGIEAKAKRLIDVSKSRTSALMDHELKNEIDKATSNLEQVTRKMTYASKRIINTTTHQQSPDEEAMKELVESLQQVLECIHHVQKLLSNIVEPLDNTSHTTVHVTPVTATGSPKRYPPSTSTPLETWDGSSIGPSPPPPSLPLSLPPTDDRPILSPSDDWIRFSSFETSPSSFAPTNPSVMYDPYQYDVSTIMTPPHSHQPIITYPSTLNGNTPSYLGGTGISTWQQDPPSGDYWGKEKPPDSGHLLESYVLPLKSVISAATHNDTKELHSKASVLTAQTQKLSQLAESAAANTQNHDTARILNKTSAKLSHLTPRIIREAEQIVDHRGDSNTLEDLRQQWTGHVNTLLEASQDANMPWSQTARRLVTSAKTRQGLNKEASHVNSQTVRMVSVAATSIKAASIEDAIGSTANLDHAQDPIVQEQIEKVRSQVESIESVTPDMISTAHNVAHGQPQEDKLHILSHEWATTASGLMKGVDDITIGMSGPADTLIIAANSNDASLLEQQAISIKKIADSMLAIAHDAVQGCNNEEQVQSVLETAEMLQKLSVELAECAHEIASLLPDKKGQESHQITVEKGEILRRDWAAKMHLLTAYIDDLTAGVAGPLDKLISVALQASRTDGMAKDHLLKQFDKKEEFVTEQLEEVNAQLEKVSKEHPLQNCLTCMGFLQDVSPHAIGAARSLATDPSSTKLDHFSHLRRQWAAKAQCFYSSLLKASETTDVTSVISAFEDLLQGYRTTRSTPSTYKPKGNSKWPQQQDSSISTSIPQLRYYSTEDIEPPSYPPPPVPSVDDSYLDYKGRGGSEYPWTIDTSTASEEDMIETSLNRSLVVAAKSLHNAVEEFEEEGNPLVSLAKRMSEQMYQMAEFTCGRGKLKSMKDMIDMSKCIAEGAQKIVRYAEMISKHCTDKRIKNDLQYCVKMIPTLSNQLNIIASVKFSTMAETDLSRADKMLEKNAQNLMIAVVQTIKAAEAAYVKGLTSPTVSEDEDIKVIEWKKKTLQPRTTSAANYDTITAKGLRKLKKDRHSSLVSQVLHSPHV